MDHGTDVNAVNQDGVSALNWAIVSNHSEVVGEILIRIVLDNGCDINQIGQDLIDLNHLNPELISKIKEYIMKEDLTGRRINDILNTKLTVKSNIGLQDLCLQKLLPYKVDPQQSNGQFIKALSNVSTGFAQILTSQVQQEKEALRCAYFEQIFPQSALSSVNSIHVNHDRQVM